MMNIYMSIKFDTNIFIGDRNMAKNKNPRWPLPTSWILQKLGLWATITHVWQIS